MSGFALPPDPDEKKKKKEEAKEEAAKPKVPPEKESMHRMVFAIVLYICLLALLFLLIPTVGSAFNTRAAIPGPEDSSGTLRMVWEALDQVVVVRRLPREDNLLRAYRFSAGGPMWWLVLLPPLLIVGLQFAVKDKTLACRLHYLVALGMTLALIALGALTVSEVVAMRS